MLCSFSYIPPFVYFASFTVSPDQTNIVFPRGQLEPETPYYIRVEAENVHGKGPLSDISQFTTLTGAPLDSPSDVLVQVGPDNSITASWSPPSQPNGQLQHYTVSQPVSLAINPLPSPFL
jgi:hypothetical protein